MRSDELAKELGLGELTLPAELCLTDGRFCAIRKPGFLDVLACKQAAVEQPEMVAAMKEAGVGDAMLLYFLIERIVKIDDGKLHVLDFFQLDTYDAARIVAYVMSGIDKNIPPKKTA